MKNLEACPFCGATLKAEPAITEPGWIIFHECVIQADTESAVMEKYHNTLKDPETWETVEQWEKRTGKVYPYDAPVFIGIQKFNLLPPVKFFDWRLSYRKEYCANHPQIVATHLGKPPADWGPEGD